MPIVAVQPSWQLRCAMPQRRRGDGVSPFTQGCLGEALGLAVCLGRVGPCPDVFEAEDFAGGAEGAAFIAAAVIGHDP